MSISSTARRAGPFFGNGVATDFAFDFKLFKTEELRVVRLLGASNAEVDLVMGVDYDAVLNADQDENPGGGVTLRAPLAAGDRLTLVSAVPELQPVDITNQGGFYPDLLNGGLDRATILVQQLKDESDRSIKLPVSATPADLTLPLPQGNQLLTWNGDGSALVNRDPGELISVVTYGNTKADFFDGDGTTRNFTLSASPGSVNNMQIAINGVMQVPGQDYNWGGAKALSFVVAPPAGTKVFVRYQEALDEGTDVSGKADKNLGNVDPAAAPKVLSLEAGEHNTLKVTGGEEAPAFDPDPNVFQDVPRSTMGLVADGDDETVDVKLLTKGAGGTAITNRLVVAGNQFGQNNNLCQLIVLSSPPDLEEVNNNPTDLNLGTPRAAVFGILGGPGIGNYPDIDAVSIFGRQYGTRPVPYAVASYTATTVTFVDPLPDTVSVPITSSLQTAHTPKWFRAVVTGISPDRKTLTVYGWAKQKALTDPAFFETPTGTDACYVNVFTKGFGTNFPVELLGPIYERDGAGRLAWRDNTSGLIIPYAGGEPNATRPAAAVNAHLTELKPANFQDIMCVGEVSAVNTKGPIDYVGTLVVNDPETGAPYNIEATVGCKNFTFGWDMVQTGSYIDPETGALERGYGGFGARSRGEWLVGFESQDNKDYGFRVQRSFNSPDKAGFAYEAGNEFNEKIAFLVAPNKDQHWAVNGKGNMQIGSKTINYGGNSILWFTSGDANQDASLIVSGGAAGGAQLATFQWIGGAHQFQGGDGTTQFRVLPRDGATDYVQIAGGVSDGAKIGVTSTNTDADLRLTPKGAGVINFDYIGAGVSATNAANFVADRMIPIKTPAGTFYVPAKLSVW